MAAARITLCKIRVFMLQNLKKTYMKATRGNISFTALESGVGGADVRLEMLRCWGIWREGKAGQDLPGVGVCKCECVHCPGFCTQVCTLRSSRGCLNNPLPPPSPPGEIVERREISMRNDLLFLPLSDLA